MSFLWMKQKKFFRRLFKLPHGAKPFSRHIQVHCRPFFDKDGGYQKCYDGDGDDGKEKEERHRSSGSCFAGLIVGNEREERSA